MPCQKKISIHNDPKQETSVFTDELTAEQKLQVIEDWESENYILATIAELTQKIDDRMTVVSKIGTKVKNRLSI